MKTQFELPSEFVPYEEIKICSNTKRNLELLLEDEGFCPIVIGKGSIPKIWLYSKSSENNDYKVLVSENVSTDHRIKVSNDSDNKYLRFSFYHPRAEWMNLLNINYKESIPEIIKIDLRPLGYNIIGDENGLKVGEKNISHQNLGKIVVMRK